MKQVKMSFQKFKRPFYRILICALAFFMLITTDCSCEKDDDYFAWYKAKQYIFDNWVIKSAVFTSEVDLDGDGPMLPTTDAKSILLDIFNFYSNCSSIDEIPIQLTSERAVDPNVIALHGTMAFSANAFCAEGMGITSWIFDYTYTESGISGRPGIIIYRDEINDPYDLFEWEGSMFLEIQDYAIGESSKTIWGLCYQDSFLSSLEEDRPSLKFSFILESLNQDE